VRARTTNAQLAPSETGAHETRVFDVEVDAGHPASGRLTVGDFRHREGARRVQAETCDEVADALALVVALAIDPRAPLAPPMPLSTSHEGSSPAADAGVAPPVASPIPRQTVPLDRPPITQSAVEDARPRSPPDRRSQKALSAGLDAALDLGVSPVPLFGPSLNVGWQSTNLALFSPSLRLAFDRAVSGTISVPNGTAAFTWTVGRLDACPVARVLHRLRLTACLRIEAGTLEVAGGDIIAPQTKLRLWLATGALARGEWTFLEPLFVNIEAGGNIRATNDRFLFLPDTTVYRVPLVGVSAAGGLGAHFL
jgi:hypothetical protein